MADICRHFELGLPIDPATRVHGGLMNKMWRLDTKNGSYAVKQISADIDLNNQVIWDYYEATETIAHRFSKLGIPAVGALEKNGQHLLKIEGSYFLVYPWLSAKVIPRDNVSEKHGLKMATIIAKMHLIDLDIPRFLVPPLIDTCQTERLSELIHHSSNPDLQKNRNMLVEANEASWQTKHLLEEELVISHGDADPKNTFWDEQEEPILIDWECARKLNPTYDVLITCLYWSWKGVTVEGFEKSVFLKMLQTYKNAGGKIQKNHIQPAFQAILGNWLNWLAYNIERASRLEDPEEQRLGVFEVAQTLQIILNLSKMIPDLNSVLVFKDKSPQRKNSSSISKQVLFKWPLIF